MADTENSKTTETDIQTKSATAGKTPKKQATKSSKLVVLLFVLLVILAGILGGALYYQNQQYLKLKADLQNFTDTNTTLAQSAKSDAAKALSMSEQQAEKLANLNTALQSTTDQLDELNRALQMVSDSGSDLLLLNDIDHLVTVAQQQLSLSGNVANAIISLEAAQAQLARANRSAFVSLQQSINGDLDRLRAVATVNLPALSNQLDQLIVLLNKAPLLVPDMANLKTPDAPVDTAEANNPNLAEQTEPNTASNTSGETPYWREFTTQVWSSTKQLAGSLSQDLRDLFDIRKVNDKAALLITPYHAQRILETLTQREITAQLALMMNKTKILQDELQKIDNAITKRFDMRSQDSREAQRITRELHDTQIQIELPNLENSLSAIAAVREDISTEQAEQDQAALDTTQAE